MPKEQVTLVVAGAPVTFTRGAWRVEACRRYRVGNRFPPGPCRKHLPEGATSVDGPDKDGGEDSGKSGSSVKRRPDGKKQSAAPAGGDAGKPVKEKPDKPVKDKPVKKVSARKLFGPEGQRELKPVTDPAKLAALGDVYGTSHNGMTSSVSKVSANSNRVVVEGIISGPDGKKIGEFVRELRLDRRGGMYADHSVLTIDPEFQGQGFAREFNNKAIDWYRQQGMSRVQLLANIDVGAYAWARGGWDWASPFDSEVLKVRLRGMAGGGDAQAAKLAQEMLDRFDGAEFGSAAYPTPFELSEMGRRPGQGRGDNWPGKVLFASTVDPEDPGHLSWNAELVLSRGPSRGRAAGVTAGPSAGVTAAVEADADRVEMMEALAAAHDGWVGEHVDGTKYVMRKGSPDFNLYYLDVDGAGQVQDGLSKAAAGVLGRARG